MLWANTPSYYAPPTGEKKFYNINAISEHLFYQLFIQNFGNFGALRLRLDILLEQYYYITQSEAVETVGINVDSLRLAGATSFST